MRQVDALGERVDPRAKAVGEDSLVAPPESQFLFPCHRHLGSKLLNGADEVRGGERLRRGETARR